MSVGATGDLGPLSFMHRDDTGYVLLDSPSIRGESVPSTHHRYFLDHGTAPAAGAYAVVYLPGADAAKTESYAANPGVKVLQLDGSLQLIEDAKSGVVGAAFFDAASHPRIGSNLPGYVLCRADEAGFALSLHNPHLEPNALTGRPVPNWPDVLNPKLDYQLDPADAKTEAYAITVPYALTEKPGCNGMDLFSLSGGEGETTIAVALRAGRKIELWASKQGGGYEIYAAWTGLSDVAVEAL